MHSIICRCGICTLCVPREPEEARGSRAPEGHVAVDPLFARAIEEIPEDAAVEKGERG